MTARGRVPPGERGDEVQRGNWGGLREKGSGGGADTHALLAPDKDTG